MGGLSKTFHPDFRALIGKWEKQLKSAISLIEKLFCCFFHFRDFLSPWRGKATSKFWIGKAWDLCKILSNLSFSKKKNICSPTSLFYIIQSNVPYISCRVSHELCNYFIFNYTDDKMKTYLQCSPTKKKRNIIYCFHQLRKNNSVCKYLS